MPEPIKNKGDKETGEITNLHINHRRRLKERFKKEGLEGFSLHNVIELLLFWGIPRRDTNETAHLLENRFESLAGLFDAEMSQICEIDGVGEHTALLIKLIPELWRRYYTEKENAGQRQHISKAGKYLVGKYIGVRREIVYALFYDNSDELIDCVKLGDGTLNSSYVLPRRLAEIGFEKNAASFIIAHNNPGGTTEPSRSDIKFTQTISETFSVIGMPLRGHIIIAGDNYKNIMT